MDGVIRNLETATRPGRNNALNGAAWTLGHWIAAGALEQSDVEEALYAAAVANGLVADDGERQCVVQLHRHPCSSATSWPVGRHCWSPELPALRRDTMWLNRGECRCT